MSYLLDPAAWIAFLTLTSLELVLGIDNLIFISILVDKLQPHQRERIRRIGLFFAMFMRIGLLLLLSWVVGATDPLLTLFGKSLSPRDLILLGGGLFLLWKSTHEVHQMIEGDDEAGEIRAIKTTAMAVTLQIIIIDLVFSLDSIVTAVGMVDDIPVMIAAVVASVALMMLFARPIGNFVSQHPTIKMLALSFLVVIGITLIVEGFGTHVAKGYIYFAMAFALGVELLNLLMKKKRRRDQAHPDDASRDNAQ
jgi:predicted tellurium resistance membrane protein TerC